MLSAALQLLRPTQWLKSLFVLSGLVYSQQFEHSAAVLYACVAFALISSAIYIYNDLHDIHEDQQHPLKRLRPLASGRITASRALLMMGSLAVFSGVLAYSVSLNLLLIIGSYVLLNLFYNHIGKQIPWLDVFCISAGFFLRVAAGTWGVGIPLSFWLGLTATLLSFYLALSKRLLELQQRQAHEGRSVLLKYNRRSMRYGFMVSALLCPLVYASYVIQVHAHSLWFVLSIIPVALGMGQFTRAVLSEKILIDDPLQILAYDRWIQLYVSLFFLLSFRAIWDAQ
ncbi:MAG: UbiA family prenyltransferase [Legionellaceae bacterium]|nr:UbiA family prenyltransferase [Legionellaceae bacterium]